VVSERGTTLLVAVRPALARWQPGALSDDQGGRPLDHQIVRVGVCPGQIGVGAVRKTGQRAGRLSVCRVGGPKSVLIPNGGWACRGAS
jgi:hypothetical protein